jgi:hypothetical protein
MPRNHPTTQVPRRLIVLEVIGTALILVGILESLGPQLLMPVPLRFNGYGLVLIVMGIWLITPLVGHLLQPAVRTPRDTR